MDAHHEWALHGPFLDKTLVRNYMWYNISGEIMEYSPNVRFFELVLNGEYRGLYLATEMITAGKEGARLNLQVNKKDNTVLVEGINMVTKHAKPSMANQQGGILHQEAPIDASNVMLLVNGKATRVGFKMDGDKKVRFAKATGEIIK